MENLKFDGKNEISEAEKKSKKSPPKNKIETGLKKIGFSETETNGILGNNWYNFYKTI